MVLICSWNLHLWRADSSYTRVSDYAVDWWCPSHPHVQGSICVVILVSVYWYLVLVLFLMIFYWLCYYSCLIFPPLPPSTQYPPPTSGNPTIVHVHGSCIGSLATPFPTLYFTSPRLFSDYYLYFLLPSPLCPFPHSPFPHSPFPPGTNQNTLCIHDSVSILICLVCFLDSTVHRYVLIVIYLS